MRVISLNLANPYDIFTPVLQTEDGTYFGTEAANRYSPPLSMNAVDTSGNVKWSVPAFSPVMATADGGLIAKSNGGQYVTFDQNGVANGMVEGEGGQVPFPFGIRYRK